MSSALETAGYQGLVEPGNGTGAQQDTSNVYFVATDAAARAVAQSIALDLGGVPTAEMPATRPASGGATDTATVLVMLGADAANKSLSELSGASCGRSQRGHHGRSLTSDPERAQSETVEDGRHRCHERRSWAGSTPCRRRSGRPG